MDTSSGSARSEGAGAHSCAALHHSQAAPPNCRPFCKGRREAGHATQGGLNPELAVRFHLRDSQYGQHHENSQNRPVSPQGLENMLRFEGPT